MYNKTKTLQRSASPDQIFGKTLAFYLIIAITSFFNNQVSAQPGSTVQLSWLGADSPALSTGVSWGVPFPEGQVKPGSNFSLKNAKGNPMAVQAWPLAFWPDGSLKWIGFSTVVDANSGSTFELQPVKETNANPSVPKVSVKETADNILINTGILQCDIPKKGTQLISSLKINNQDVSSGGKLVCIRQMGPEKEYGIIPERENYVGNIEKVTVEQNGPVRAVVKIEGRHVDEKMSKSWLPFIVRLYFYAGQQSVRMVHTLIYDGDQEKDFIRGLGVVFDVPLDEELYNRHIRFSGENGGLWDEPAEPLYGSNALMENGENLYTKQLTGARIAQRETFNDRQKSLIDHWASWNDFKLVQSNADGFTVQKRTGDGGAWINAGAGKRSSGLAYVGDVSGGLTLCVRNFWQSYPASLEVREVKTKKAELRAWLWSPDAPAMDMRSYDTLAWGHTLAASYEDAQPGFGISTGVGRTSEILLYASSEVPNYKTLNEIAEQGNQPPLLTVSPDYIHRIPVFGVWSLPDRSTKGKQWLEDELDNAFKYYQLEVEQRHWYGFWDYGDFMHAYDTERHVWKYDIGGYAWDNTELMPNMWLWYSYLRSGRKDIFRMAEALTRHTGEVDVYHTGRFEGLGSRHNVRHWGCGSKEVRIAPSCFGALLLLFNDR